MHGLARGIYHSLFILLRLIARLGRTKRSKRAPSRRIRPIYPSDRTKTHCKQTVATRTCPQCSPTQGVLRSVHGLSKLLWQAAALRDDNAKRPRRVRGSRRRRLQGQQPRPPMPDYRSEKKKGTGSARKTTAPVDWLQQEFKRFDAP